MKKLFLILLLLPNLLNAASAASAEPIPAAFDTQNMPTLNDFNTDDLFNFLKNFYKNYLSKMQTDIIKKSDIATLLMQENFIQKLGDKAEITAKLFAFIMTELKNHQHQRTSNQDELEALCQKHFVLNFSSKKYKYNMSLSLCGCIHNPVRILDIFYMTISIFSLYQEKKLTHINYVSVASGNLLHDYIVLALLIKLGIPLNINLIDIIYDLADQKNDPLNFEVNIMETFIEYFKFRLFEIHDAFKKETHIETSLRIRAWKSIEDYLITLIDPNSKIFTEGILKKHQELINKHSTMHNPHILSFVDLAGDPNDQHLKKLYEEINIIKTKYANKNGFINHYLNPEKTEVKLTIEKEQISVINFEIPFEKQSIP